MSLYFLYSLFLYSSNDSKEAPFFVIGSGRNGSTLLATWLNQYKNIFMPSEQFFLPKVVESELKYRHLNTTRMKQKWISDSIKYNQDWLYNAHYGERLKREVKNCVNSSQFFMETLKCQAAMYKNEVALFGDHSPLMTEYVPLILNLFPKAKFICLIRDPRAVVNSYIKFNTHRDSDILRASAKWNKSAFIFKWLEKYFPQQQLLIRYEDLLNDRERNMKLILEFLEVFETAELSNDYSKNPIISSSKKYTHLSKIGQTIDSSRAMGFKDELSQSQQSEILSITSDYYKLFYR